MNVKLAIILTSTFLTTNLVAQNVTLKIAHFLPSNSNAQTDVIEPWCKQLATDSNNQIKCQIYPSMQLGGTPAKLADIARNGVADIVWTAPSYSAGKFPRVEALELPFVMPYGGVRGNQIIWQFYQKYAQEDFKDYKVLSLNGDNGMDLHLRDKPVRSLADLKGLKIRASNRVAAQTLTALGATPVAMPPAQMTESIAKGVVDGALSSWEVVIPTKLDEVTKYHTNNRGEHRAFGYTVLAVLMNKQKYASLPDDLKEVIDRNSGEALSIRFGKSWDSYTNQALEQTDANNLNVISAQDFASMKEASKTVITWWIKEASAKNIDGKTLLAGLQEMVEETDFKAGE